MLYKKEKINHLGLYLDDKILTNELEIQNQKRNQEIEELFEDIDTENTSLKKELFEVKEELKEEKDKNNSIKNSMYSNTLINIPST